MRVSRLLRALFCAFLIPQSSFAAGFELLEQSAEGLGKAFAGSSTGSFSDGSAVFYNAAAMTRHSTVTTSFGAHLIVPHAEFDNENSRYIPQLGAGALRGNNGGDGGEAAVIPNFYAVTPLTDRVSAGISINTPFGLATNYNDTWVGRYHAVTSELQTVDITPAIGIKVNEWFSIGAGVQAMYAKAKLTNMVDFGTIALATPGIPSQFLTGLTPGSADGHVRVKGDDWGAGWTAGALFQLSDSTSLGIAYRSGMKFNLRGSAEYTVPSRTQFLTASGAFIDSGARAELETPGVLNAGIATELCSGWKVYVDGAWIDWSVFNELRVQFDTPQPDAVQEEQWEDTWRASLGTQYEASERLSLRGGVMYDKSPVPNVALRTPRIPDADRYWLSFGAGYKITDSLRIDGGYAHLFVPEAHSSDRNATGAILEGSWTSSVDILSLSLVATF